MTPQDLIAAFDTVAEAPDGVKRLREMVLQLAVRGKLVPQNPEDEPASKLLKRIAVEKARLVKEKKIKKPKLQPSIHVADLPFEVPPGWIWTRFGIVANSRLGKMLDKAKNKGPLREYLRNKNVQWYRFDLSSIKQLRLEEHELFEYSIQKGDLIICEGGEPGRVAVADETVETMIFQKALHRARPWLGINSWYLAYLLKCDAESKQLNQYFTGATIKHFTGRALNSYVIPLPPLAEQHRIVARVDELMALLDRLEAARTARDATRAATRDSALAALQEANTPEEVETAWNRFAERMDDLLRDPADVAPVRQAVLQLAVRGKLVPQNPEDESAKKLLERIAKKKERLFQEKTIRKQKPLSPIKRAEVPFDLPPGWEWCRIQTLSREVTDGVHKTPTYVASGVPFLSIKDISSGFLNFSNTRFVTEEAHREMIKRCHPQRGDILLCRIGTLGRAVVVDTNQEFSLFVSVGLIKMTGDINPRFFQYVLNSPASYAQYDRIKAGGSHTNKLNVGTMRSAVMPVAPLAEQHRIVARVDELMALLDRLEAHLTAAKTTHAAFAASAVHHLDT